jgi:hypothetical protein
MPAAAVLQLQPKARQQWATWSLIRHLWQSTTAEQQHIIRWNSPELCSDYPSCCQGIHRLLVGEHGQGNIYHDIPPDYPSV